jgi:hypothetical protein
MTSATRIPKSPAGGLQDLDVDYQSVSKRIQHPLLGTLDFDIEILQPTHDPDQRLIVYTTHAGSPTHEALRQLKDRQTTYAQPD